MIADLMLKALIAMAPVLILLVVFDRLDVFNLIPMRDIALLGLAGIGLALFSFVANWRVMDGFPIGWSAYSRYVAPIIEESMKAAPIIFMFSRNRLGFKLDAAIAGFAVGAGFSMAENAWYLLSLTNTNISDWLVRGLGTAVMHGAATAIFAVITHEFTEKQAQGAASQYVFQLLLFAPGLLAAMAAHSLFNHFPSQPMLAMVATLILAPLALFLTLAKSERATLQWLATDAAAHRSALQEIRASGFAESKALRDVIAGATQTAAADAVVYAELKMELVLRAEELILASHEGRADAAGEPELEKFARLDAIEQRLGKALANAIAARIGFTRNDLYELDRLRAALRVRRDDPPRP